MANRRFEIRFPRAGVVSRHGYEEAAIATRDMYPTPWAVNIRPEDTIERRRRGGSRPGIAAGGDDLPTETVQVTNGAASVYNAASGATTSVLSATGTMPEGFTFGEMYRGRLCLASGAVAYFSRLGDVTDWDYDADMGDQGRATMVPLAEAFGGSEQDITAVIPFRDSACLLGSVASLWRLRGDPITGQLANVTRSVGPIGSRAWTIAEDTVVFMAKDGLWAVSPEGGEPKPLSKDRVPEDLRDLNGANVHLAYSPDERGVYSFIDGGEYQWFYDMEDGGFWPMTLDAGSVPDRSAIVDGVLRLERDGLALEIGATETIQSDLLVGPIRLGANSGETGQVLKMAGALAEGSGLVSWNLITGDTAEEAVKKAKAAVVGDTGYVASSGVFAAGRSYSIYPRVRAPWLVIWLSSVATWAFEAIWLDVAQAGPWR